MTARNAENSLVQTIKLDKTFDYTSNSKSFYWSQEKECPNAKSKFVAP